jgi:hypothetical protein
MSDSAAQAPTSWDSLKFSIAVGLVAAYFPAFFLAEAYFGSTGFITVFIAFVLGALALRCSNCSLSLFNHGELWKPWPWRSCPQCARPLVPRARTGDGVKANGAQAPPNKSLERTREG